MTMNKNSRTFRTPRLLLTPLLLVAATVASAQAQKPYAMINAAAASSPVTITKARGNISVLQGSGGNITVLSGPEGFFLVDAGIAVSKQKIGAALQKLGNGKIRYLANTHWHWDHTDGNGWVQAAGATVMAHPRTIAHLGQTIRIVEWGHTFTPVSKLDLPTVAIPSERTVKLNGETVRIMTIGDGHTDGDLSVNFEKANVLALGDTFWNGMYPFVDYMAGGDIDGAIRQANAGIARSNANTIIVPGHGPIGRRADLIAFRDMLVDVRAKVAALKAKGRTLEQTIAAKPTAAYDAKWGKSIVNPALFTALVYRGV